MNHVTKKIQFIITGLGPGGAERQLTGLASMLKEKGYTVQVCWYTNINFYEQVLLDNGIDCKRLYTSNHLKKIKNIWQAIKSFNPDVVISFLDGPNTICPYLKWLTRGKYKLIVSERNTTQRLDRRSRLRFVGYRFADHIVPNSGSQTRFIGTHYPQYKDKLSTITNFTDLERFQPTEKKAGTTLRGMVAARVTEAKNVLRFIDAVSIAHDKGANIDITWFGQPFYKEYGEQCHKLIEDKNMSQYFHLLPATKQIVDEYKKSDVVILPSHFEGCPNVVCEAISCGLPVLCSDVCDNSTLVHNGVNGFLFDKNDESSMAETIVKFCNLNSDERRSMGMASRKLAESILSKDRFVNQYINLINELLKS